MMSKRKPMLPELTSVLLSREQHINEPDVSARAELRAVEAAIRTGGHVKPRPVTSADWAAWDRHHRAYARLARVTGRDHG